MNVFNRINRVIFVACMLVFVLSGCRCGIALEPGNYDRNNMELYTIAAFSIPHADFVGTKIKPIEGDSYGRV